MKEKNTPQTQEGHKGLSLSAARTGQLSVPRYHSAVSHACFGVR